jgi:uncharacterized CHY-type Zn-finger protein
MAEQIKVRGKLVNEQTGCVHYSSPVDIIAIKFRCCDNYYACYYCHQELEDHDPQVWQKDEFDTKAILCGYCRTELTIHEYFNSGYRCPHCSSSFNPKCRNHNHFYFEQD